MPSAHSDDLSCEATTARPSGREVVIISYDAFRKNLVDYLDQVAENRTELHVIRQGSSSVVVLAEEEFASIRETLHLVRSAANARRLLNAMADADAGKLTEFDPTDGRR